MKWPELVSVSEVEVPPPPPSQCAPSPPPGIPLVCFLVLLPLNIPWSQISVTWLGVVHFLACLSPQLGSVLYHLFMNHEGGEPVYHTLLKLDVCGICMINTLGESRSLRGGREGFSRDSDPRGVDRPIRSVVTEA